MTHANVGGTAVRNVSVRQPRASSVSHPRIVIATTPTLKDKFATCVTAVRTCAMKLKES
jgi:hypothetical protein